MNRRHALLGVAGAMAAAAMTGSAATAPQPEPRPADTADAFDPGQIQALAFDVQGTVLDFYSPLLAGITQAFERRGVDVAVDPFITEWRTGYRTVIDAILAGSRPWVPTELVYANALDVLLDQRGLSGKFSLAERTTLTELWAQMVPWPDAKSGLERMRAKFVVTTLSNSGMATVGRMLKQTDLRFDYVLTAELARSFKPDGGVYRLVPMNLGVPTRNILMVACHKYDLAGARRFGFRTGYVPRPRELGPNGKRDAQPEAYIDVIGEDFNDLAGKLGA